MISLIEQIPYVAYPLALYEKLEQNNTLLFESAEIESKTNTKSLLMAKACLKLICNHNTVIITSLTPNGEAFLKKLSAFFKTPIQDNTLTLIYPQVRKAQDEFNKLFEPSPFDALRGLFKSISTKHKHPFSFFCAGLFSFEMLNFFEDLPKLQTQDNTANDFIFYVAQNLIIIDHKEKTTEILGTCFDTCFRIEIEQELQKLKELAKDIQQDFIPKKLKQNTEISTNCSDSEFEKKVLFLQEEIKKGEIFQAVLSRSFYMECKESLSAYYHLKLTNPSPYMFYIKDSDFILFGASPESALKYNALTNTAEIYPIAGTRLRGKDTNGNIDYDLDSKMEFDLQHDYKERAEHIMLVDLARNDMARIAKKRYCNKLLKVDKYSNVMHLVSCVVGELKKSCDSLHAYRSFMNAGTLSGAPKISAIKLIYQLENQRRGSYGGSVGYLNNEGSMDSCITIRSCFVKNNRAVIQAGAGIVLDSNPKSEADETKAKAQALIFAIRKTSL
ncbi:anthranilate synthase component I [Helicobacter cetorum]|uniref:anthranilate synthase component I n=1 Tax=Helicobacter cetorum TaxID=138563 RepID=UPI000CF03700|nr:anthranilate synthase component I [Helicobacter cetorum]